MDRIAEILKCFDIPSVQYRTEPLGQGLINQTYVISVGLERKYVLQRINQQVFPNPGAIEQNLELVLPLLSSRDYAGLDFQRTRAGDLFYRDADGEQWRLMRYLDGSLTHHCSSDLKVAFEAGRILGVFHRLVSPVDPKALAVVIDRFHSLDWRFEQYETALDTASKRDLMRVAPFRGFVSDVMSQLEAYRRLRFPVRVCHNDTKLNNILFSSDGRALCLIDLDTLMPGYFVYDFGDVVRTLANPAPEEEKDLSKIEFSMDMFQAFVKGLALNDQLLKETEKKGLAMSTVYMPFLHGLRAFTDFLEGNRYYKVSYPDENLDRARSLFQFAGLALENQGKMERILAAELN